MISPRLSAPETPRELRVQHRRADASSASTILLVQWRLFDFEFYDSRTNFRKFRLEHCVLSPDGNRVVNLALELDLQFDNIQKQSVADPFYANRFTSASPDATLFSHPIYAFGISIVLLFFLNTPIYSHVYLYLDSTN